MIFYYYDESFERERKNAYTHALPSSIQWVHFTGSDTHENFILQNGHSLEIYGENIWNSNFFLDTIHYWEVFYHILKNILINSLFSMLINPFSPSEKVQLRGFDCIGGTYNCPHSVFIYGMEEIYKDITIE